MKFQRVLLPILSEVPEGSGADAEVKFRKVPVQIHIGEVPEASGADAEVRFQEFPVQRLGQVPEGSGLKPRSRSGWLQRLGEVPEGSGPDT